jgi:hypothetical protein
MIAGGTAAIAVTGIVPRAVEIPLIVIGSILAGAPGVEFIRVRNRCRVRRDPVFSM